MSTTALTGLLEYLYGTLSTSDMRWVAEQLADHAKQQEEHPLKRYTMEEINAMLDEAEAEAAAGGGISHEEAMREWEEEIEREERELVSKEELELAEAV